MMVKAAGSQVRGFAAAGSCGCAALRAVVGRRLPLANLPQPPEAANLQARSAEPANPFDHGPR
jgi:hypothetical protein